MYRFVMKRKSNMSYCMRYINYYLLENFPEGKLYNKYLYKDIASYCMRYINLLYILDKLKGMFGRFCYSKWYNNLWDRVSSILY